LTTGEAFTEEETEEFNKEVKKICEVQNGKDNVTRR
jgi:hypothetical protein